MRCPQGLATEAQCADNLPSQEQVASFATTSLPPPDDNSFHAPRYSAVTLPEFGQREGLGPSAGRDSEGEDASPDVTSPRRGGPLQRTQEKVSEEDTRRNDQSGGSSLKASPLPSPTRVILPSARQTQVGKREEEGRDLCVGRGQAARERWSINPPASPHSPEVYARQQSVRVGPEAGSRTDPHTAVQVRVFAEHLAPNI